MLIMITLGLFPYLILLFAMIFLNFHLNSSYYL